MDHGLEALVGFVGAHGDAFEFLEFTEEVLDEMTPFVHLGVDLERDGAARVLRNHDLGTALIEIGDDVVAVEGLVGDQRASCRVPSCRCGFGFALCTCWLTARSACPTSRWVAGSASRPTPLVR